MADEQMPTGSIDSHMHIIEPAAFPLARDARYQPSSFTLHDAEDFQQTVGIRGMVMVQPSIYGTDNSCLLAALKKAGPGRARGVIVCNPTVTSQGQLRDWHEQGVRGIRINLESVNGKPDIDAFLEQLRQSADLIRPLNWVLDLYIPMSILPTLENTLLALDVKICLDHFGSPRVPRSASLGTSLPTPPDPYAVDGFDSLARLVAGAKVWVKISATYRIAQESSQLDMLKAIGLELLQIAPTQLIWASDWPHTRHEGLDINPFIQECLRWCRNDEVLKARLFRDNANMLWS